MVSVIIPLYNKENTVAKAIECVLNQSYQNFEIIIVNDGSSDGSVDVVKQFTDPRIRIVSQNNAGVSAARNRGIAESKGDFVAFLDADDKWLTDYLLSQMDLVKRYPECDVFAVDYIFHTPAGARNKTIINNIAFDGLDGVMSNYFLVASCSHPPLWTSAVMVRKTAVEEIGGFPAGVRSGEDLLTWARLVCRFKVAYSRNALAVYNLGEGYDFANQPPRRQDEGDPVGKELVELFLRFKPMGMKRYIGHWHKMRASVAIRYGERAETLKEAWLSWKWYPLNIKIIPFFILPLLPDSLLRKIVSLHK